MKMLFTKYRGIIAYLFFGVCTTAINILIYYLCARQLRLSTGVSTVAAWVLAVLFAYVTNKLYVFQSRSWEKELVIQEIASFFGCRLMTGALDLAIMLICVDLMQLYDVGIKIFSNLLVIVLNYIASKLVVFRRR